MRLLVHPCLYTCNTFSFYNVHYLSKLYRSVSCTEVRRLHQNSFLPYTRCLPLCICPSSLTMCSCTAYNGNECTSVFGAANITTIASNGGGSSFISTNDATIVANFDALSAASAATSTSISQACLNYIRFIQCLSLYTPCSGTAWCGSMSETELTDAVSTACGCSGRSCTIGGFSVATIRNYYQGSSSTGQVGSALSCQDVTLGELEVYSMTCACTAYK